MTETKRSKLIDEICHKRHVIKAFQEDEERVLSRGRLDESYEIGYEAGLRVGLKIIDSESIKKAVNRQEELVEALGDVLLQFDSCTVRQENLKTKIAALINKANQGE